MTKRNKGKRVDAGRYYGLAPDGMHELPMPEGTMPDVVVARRVTDFPGQRVPAGGTVVTCTACHAPVVTNLAKFPEVPRRCMQCEHIMPEPLQEPS